MTLYRSNHLIEYFNVFLVLFADFGRLYNHIVIILNPIQRPTESVSSPPYVYAFQDPSAPRYLNKMFSSLRTSFDAPSISIFF
jgi:hypothetical protein